MAYKFITDYNAVSYTPGRYGCAIDKIIIHHWGDDGQTFDGIISWFQSPSCSTSAHAVLEAGKVACIVNYYDTAYHAGDWNANLTSIGIECRPEMSDGDLETLCEYIADLWTYYGILPIYGHKDFSLTACPGRYYAKLSYIKQRATEIYNDKLANEGDDDEMNWNDFVKSPEYQLLHELVEARQALGASDWAKEDFQEAIDKGITTGERPQDYLSREEGAIMVLRASKLPHD